METLGDRIRKARRDKKMTQQDVANLFSISRVNITQWESNTTRPDQTKLAKLAEHLGGSIEWFLTGKGSPASQDQSPIPVQQIRVEGVSHAGRFEDISLIDDDEYSREVLAAPKDDRFPHAHQYALKVSGDSMNLRYPDGGYVVCAAWQDTGLELRDGHAVHVERIRFASERETTIKIYREIDDKRWLYPDSTNKNHQPIEINGDPDIEIIIKGIILATYSKQAI